MEGERSVEGETDKDGLTSTYIKMVGGVAIATTAMLVTIVWY